MISKFFLILFLNIYSNIVFGADPSLLGERNDNMNLDRLDLKNGNEIARNYNAPLDSNISDKNYLVDSSPVIEDVIAETLIRLAASKRSNAEFLDSQNEENNSCSESDFEASTVSKLSKLKNNNFKSASEVNLELIAAYTRTLENSKYNCRKRAAGLKIKLIEIFCKQHPGKKYNLRNFKIRNFPVDISVLKVEWNNEEMKKIEEKMDSFIFVESVKNIAFDIQFGFDKLNDLTEILDHRVELKQILKILLERFRIETGKTHVKRIEWKLLDYSKLSPRYKDIIINNISIRLKTIFANPEITDNIHFFHEEPNEIESEIQEIIIEEKQEEEFETVTLIDANSTKTLLFSRAEELEFIEIMLKSVFKAQHPDENYVLKNFKLINWPIGIVRDKEYWKSSDIIKILKRMNQLVFKKYDSLEEQLEDLDDILMKDWTYPEVYKFILERFRVETNNPNAQNITWKLLNRSNVPKRFDAHIINYSTMKYEMLYKVPHIVNNIHFCEKDSEGKFPHTLDFVPSPKRKRSRATMESEQEEHESLTTIDQISTVKQTDTSNELSSKKLRQISETDSENEKDAEISFKSTEKDDANLNQNSPLIIEEEFGFENHHLFEDPQLELLERHRERILAELKTLCESQTQISVFNLTDFNVINWPEDVDVAKSLWNPAELDQIEINLKSFIFVPRENSENPKSADSIDETEAHSITRTIMYENLLKRYREESGFLKATFINFSYLDRNRIPTEFDHIQINSETIMLSEIYKVAAIFDNIHFRNRKKSILSDQN